ncbi:N-acetylneuraminate synthase [Fimbriimonas ginsengisoli]|uniref:NeuB family protein n=1 Tax=Fimbriimonas ginsengisoli Gsoil 348 TaxID=661478 RepID=A0A068NTH2_FIMGI|nr:N-acetylneuraminate synthase [Fimbriimonas ginsengisoli]AIE86637.1 NeuB family protein [Fimbriimonas ginsengisoli Gsoil 348]
MATDWLPSHCLFIAEAGVNHNGDLALAVELIDAAKAAGADAVKFQSFKTDQLVTRSAAKADYQKRSTDAEESQFEMVRRLELSEEAHEQLIQRCKDVGIQFMSTPFDEESAAMLARLGVPCYKLPSGEVTNLPFLRHVAGYGVPIILSTGMSTLAEVDQAVQAILETGNDRLALLHCVSNYPADPADVNLRAMHTMDTAFGLPVGYSDHTTGFEVTLAAVALGARIIEKHFTLDRNLPGPDHKASLEPDEIAAAVRGVRVVESALGTGRKVPAASEANTASVARRSLVAARDLPAGTRLSEADIAILRPGTGLPPAMLPHLVGMTLSHPVSAGDLFRLDAI